MTTKSPKGNLFFIVFLFVLLTASACIFTFGFPRYGVYFGVVIFIFAVISSINWYIAVFREITLDANGVLVCFYRYKRFYPWDSLSVSYESYENTFRGSRGDSYDADIIIKPKELRSPKILTGLAYCIFFHPFRFICLHIEEDKRGRDMLEEHQVDKQEFLKKMTAWGVIDSDFFEKKN